MQAWLTLFAGRIGRYQAVQRTHRKQARRRFRKLVVRPRLPRVDQLPPGPRGRGGGLILRISAGA